MYAACATKTNRITDPSKMFNDLFYLQGFEYDNVLIRGFGNSRRRASLMLNSRLHCSGFQSFVSPRGVGVGHSALIAKSAERDVELEDDQRHYACLMFGVTAAQWGPNLLQKPPC